MCATLAMIPARAGSKRLPNKNHREFLGKPLILWTIEFALAYPGFDKVLVSTDSPEVANLARGSGVDVPWLRPAELATDTATSLDVVAHAVKALASEGFNFERVALLQPTSPMRLTQRWDEAMAYLDQGAAAAIGVCPAMTHPYWTYFMAPNNELAPCFPDGLSKRSQDLPMACIPNGALYLCNINALFKHRTFTPPGARGVLCSELVESIDIDTEEDWMRAERLISESL